eukprot:TRINITY_DN9536_c0_g1_i12.p5 TRINITY_DN9536_c0_g1~~TRINITY_DN9536_c0_g1_i12.p5  ORF type:complete len:103 (+),score=4.94 TRINITY_DN9536_c0_g1_i12:108-416(+)
MSKTLLFMVLMYSCFTLSCVAERSDCPAFNAVTEIWRGVGPSNYKNDYGCYNGYCWAECDALPLINEWCYTTETHSQSFQYVTCNSDDDCCSMWKCAGSCTV